MFLWGEINKEKVFKLFLILLFWLLRCEITNWIRSRPEDFKISLSLSKPSSNFFLFYSSA